MDLQKYQLRPSDHEQKTEPLQMYDPKRSYYNNGYKLFFTDYWSLSYKDRFIMSNDNTKFFQIIEMLDLKPWKVKDPEPEEFDIDIHLNKICENLSSWRQIFPDNIDLITAEAAAYGETDTAGESREYSRELELA